MRFHTQPTGRDEPEIQLIAFIDVLLVILIFLMLTTTYDAQRALQIRLPSAEAQSAPEHRAELVVTVSAEGEYTLGAQPLGAASPAALALALRRAASVAPAEPTLLIRADAQARHQAVINVMEAARQAELQHMTFATRADAAEGAH